MRGGGIDFISTFVLPDICGIERSLPGMDGFYAVFT